MTDFPRLLSASCFTAMQEKPPPRRADEVHDPVRDVSAVRPTALVHRALTPDNAHQISLRFWGIAAAPMAGPRGFGRLEPGPLAGVPGNPPEPGTPAALPCGVARGEITGHYA
jgi:hypothetical protein